MRNIFLITFTAIIAVSNGFGWGLVTHAYFSSKFGKQQRFQNYNEIYGALIRDTFMDDSLFRADPPTRRLFGSYLWGYPGYENFMELWDNAENRFERNQAYGVVINNNVWGTDITSNSDGLTYGMGVGWSVQTTRDLIPIFGTKGIWEKLQLDPDHPRQQVLCRRFTRWIVDYAGDIILAKKEKKLGKKVMKSALLRSEKGVDLLVRVIGEEYEDYIRSNEKRWRLQMILYGGLLMLPKEAAVESIAFLLSQRFSAWIKIVGAPIPPGLAGTTKEAIVIATGHIKKSFLKEIQANLNHFPAVLETYGITYP